MESISLTGLGSSRGLLIFVEQRELRAGSSAPRQGLLVAAGRNPSPNRLKDKSSCDLTVQGLKPTLSMA